MCVNKRLHMFFIFTVDIVEVELAAQHEEGAEGQAEDEGTGQVTVT